MSYMKLIKDAAFGNRKAKSNSRYKLINRVAKRAGFRLHSTRFSAWEDAEHGAVIKKGGFPFNDKKYMIYQLAKGVANLDGDTAECGVFKGRGSFLTLEAGGRKDRPHHVFDSFEGVSEPTELDRHNLGTIKEWEKHDMAIPLEAVKQALAAYPQVKYYKGWIPTRFAEVADRKFSFVHIDVDLVEPTMQSVEFFYDHMEPGGIILCDDYAAKGTPGAKKAMDDFFRDKPENVICTVPGSGFIIKQ